MEMLINCLCGRIAIAETPRGAHNLDIFPYMSRFPRSVRMSACWQTLRCIVIMPHKQLLSISKMELNVGG